MTIPRPCSCPRWLQFQLTHPWGCDSDTILWLNNQVFQLTHPWGCDKLNWLYAWHVAYFNSHTREGVTGGICNILDWKQGFQLTHPWGCDKKWRSIFMCILTFQLTHPWGCDGRCMRSRWVSDISTHTPVRVWPLQAVWTPETCHFNSHTREGVTLHNNKI